jgi:hypothetical protein
MSRRRYSLFTTLVVLVFTLGACRQEAVVPALPVDADAPITTDRERYTPEDFGNYVTYTIEVSYTNTTDESVYLVPCSGTPPPPARQLERFDGGQWQFNYRPFCRTGPGPVPATEVEPNEGFTADLILDIYTTRTPENYGYPLLGTDIMTGVNRFVFDIVASVDENGVANGDLLPLEQRVSNAFELRVP